MIKYEPSNYLKIINLNIGDFSTINSFYQFSSLYFHLSYLNKPRDEILIAPLILSLFFLFN